MSNMLDYLSWRGDLDFRQSPFNEVDALVLSQFSYLPLDGIVSDSFDAALSLRDAAEKFFCRADEQQVSPESLVLHEGDVSLFRSMADSRRFGDLRLCGYVNLIDYDAEKQFCCVCVELEEGSHFLAYRGTDHTLVGWKEDFNMSFLPSTPAQRDAVKYLERAARFLDGRFRLGGHSKGGNLAIFAAAFCSDATQERIGCVYSNDSPGFLPDVLASEGYEKIRNRIRSFVPQSSIVGMLLEREDDYTVVHSTQSALFQHDPYSWQVERTDFVTLDEVTAESHFLNHTLKDWIADMEREKRKAFINALYDIITAADARTFEDMTEGGLKNAGAAISAYSRMDKDTKSMFSETLTALFQAGMKNFRRLQAQKEK